MASRTRLFFISLLLLGSVFFIVPARADSGETIEVLDQSIANDQQKINQLQTTINSYNASITQADTQEVSLNNQLTIIDDRIGVVSSTVQLLATQIAQNQAQLGELNFNVDQKNAAIAQQKLLLTNLINSIQSDEQQNTLSVMLSYKSFSAFYNEVKNSQTIYLDLGRSLQTLQEDESGLATTQAAAQSKQTALLAYQTQLQAEQQDLQSEQGYKQTLLAETQHSEKKYETLLASLKQQYQVIENDENTFENQAKRKFENSSQIADSGVVNMIWPVPSHVINATFHDPSYPFANIFAHSGIDIHATQGTPVQAAATGYIGEAHFCTTPSCYAYVLIVHTGSISTLYGHLSQILVSQDQFVNQGDIIGYSGATPGTVGAGPFTTGAHLHFEVRLNGIPVDPVPYLP